jgi:tetratricopeptide (TPR) repeat protein
MCIRNPFRCVMLVAFVTIFFLFFPCSKSFAGSEPPTDPGSFLILTPDTQFEYAQTLFSNKDYASAVSEFKRFVHFFPKEKRVESAMYNIGLSYYLGRHFSDAVGAFEVLIDRYVDSELAVQSYFRMSEAQLQLKASGPAIIVLHNLIAISDDEDVKDEAYYRIGWIYIDTAAWEKARLAFSKISDRNKNKYRLERLSAELDKEKWVPQKNPALAGFLSILPGAGYLYCERYRDALIAFLLNGGLIYAAYESFDKEHYALGGVITFVTFGFYAGNIYGAATSAHKYNQKKTGKFIEKLKNNAKIDLSGDVKNKGICLSFRFSF